MRWCICEGLGQLGITKAKIWVHQIPSMPWQWYCGVYTDPTVTVNTIFEFVHTHLPQKEDQQAQHTVDSSTIETLKSPELRKAAKESHTPKAMLKKLMVADMTLHHSMVKRLNMRILLEG